MTSLSWKEVTGPYARRCLQNSVWTLLLLLAVVTITPTTARPRPRRSDAVCEGSKTFQTSNILTSLCRSQRKVTKKLTFPPQLQALSENYVLYRQQRGWKSDDGSVSPLGAQLHTLEGVALPPLDNYWTKVNVKGIPLLEKVVSHMSSAKTVLGTFCQGNDSLLNVAIKHQHILDGIKPKPDRDAGVAGNRAAVSFTAADLELMKEGVCSAQEYVESFEETFYNWTTIAPCASFDTLLKLASSSVASKPNSGSDVHPDNDPMIGSADLPVTVVSTWEDIKCAYTKDTMSAIDSAFFVEYVIGLVSDFSSTFVSRSKYVFTKANGTGCRWKEDIYKMLQRQRKQQLQQG